MMSKLFVMVGSGPQVLGLPDTNLLDIFSIRCNAMDMPQRCREINAHRVEEKCNTVQILIQLSLITIIGL